MSSETRVWFITGCSSGFGRCIADHALKMDDKVVATLRKPEVLSELAEAYPETLLVLRLDVTNPDEVVAAFVASKEKFGRVDVVVNNAGFAVVSEVEGAPDKNVRDLFEVNFWGALNVSKEAVRFFREENRPMGGRLLQMSSLGGIISIPASVHYSASKFALEGLSEGLAKELHPSWNIKVTILEPGPFLTKVVKENMATIPVHPAYMDPSLPSMRWRTISTNPVGVFGGDPNKFAAVVYRVANLEDPPLRLPIHPEALRVFREKAKHLLETADKWESWSEDLLLED